MSGRQVFAFAPTRGEASRRRSAMYCNARWACRILAILSLLGPLACASQWTREVSVASAPAEQSEREQSVKPGINAEYKDADVERWKERFETESREIFHERQKIVSAVGLKPGTTIADIGAGTGLFTVLFAREVGASGKVIAVDIVPQFLEHIRSRSKAEGLVNVTTVLCKE